MPGIGGTFGDVTLKNYWGGANISLFTLKNKVLLLAFIDIERGWRWMMALDRLSEDLIAMGLRGTNPANQTTDAVSIAAIVFNYNNGNVNPASGGTDVDSAWITQKKNAEAVPPSLRFNILICQAWTPACYPNIYFGDFLGNSALGSNQLYWSYILSKDFLVTDAWQEAGGGSVSFEKLRADWVCLRNTGACGVSRLDIDFALKNALMSALVGDTRVTFNAAASYSRDTTPGTRLVSVVPGMGSPVDDPKAIVLSFSGPLDPVSANALASYTLPAPSGTFLISQAFYRHMGVYSSADPDIASMYAELRMLHLLHDAPFVIDCRPARLTTIKEVPAAGMEIVFSRPVAGADAAVYVIGGTPPGTEGALVFNTPAAYDANLDRVTLMPNAPALQALDEPTVDDSWLEITPPTTIANTETTPARQKPLSGDATIAYRVDVAAPVVTDITADEGNGYYKKDAVIHIRVSFDQNVIVTGTPKLLLNAGATANVDYAGGSGTATLLFQYTVQAGQNSAKLDCDSANALNLNSGTIRDAADNDADLTLPVGAALHSLASNRNIVIDTKAPTVTYVESDDEDRTYGAGETIKVKVVFDEPVSVTGVPKLLLNAGATAIAAYDSGSSTATTLVFQYMVHLGENSADLDCASASALSLDGGTIQDAAGNNADLTVPVGLDPNSLASHNNIVIDTQPAQNIVFVLDYSGTMMSTVTFDGSTKEKVEWVKDAVRNFTTYLLGSVVSSHYKVGIVLYTTAACQALLLTPRTGITAGIVDTALEQITQHQLTAMGKGLAWALSMLDYTTPAAGYNGYRAIILLADGQQNVQPYVVPNIPDPAHPEMGNFTIDASIPSSGCPAGMGLIQVSGSDIPIHTLGIGANATWLSTMANIAGITSATYKADADVWPLALDFFTTLLPSLFPYSSPQIVRNQKETFQAGAANRFAFSLNSSVKKVVISLNWAGTTPLKCVIRKGNRIVAFDATTQTEGLFIGSVTFPHFQPIAFDFQSIHYLHEKVIDETSVRRAATIRQRPLYEIGGVYKPGYGIAGKLRLTVDAVGDWEIQVLKAGSGPDPAQGYSFLLSVIADEKEIKYRIDPPRRIIWAGESFELGADLFLVNGPLDAYPSVEARIVRAPTSLANIIARQPEIITTVPGENHPAGGEIDDVTRKMELLAKNKVVASQLAKSVESKVRLGPFFGFSRRSAVKKGQGLKAAFSNTSTPGVYQVTYTFQARDGKRGLYQRVSACTVIVKVKPELAPSTVEARADGKKVHIVFTPRDRFCNYLGAGYSSFFKLQFDGIKIENVKDDLTGSYSFDAVLSADDISSPEKREKLKNAVFTAFMRNYLAQEKTTAQ